MLSSVVFPDPARPRRATSWPDRTVKDTPRRAWVAVRPLPKEMTEPLGMQDLVRLEAQPDHIGVWPDQRDKS